MNPLLAVALVGPAVELSDDAAVDLGSDVALRHC